MAREHFFVHRHIYEFTLPLDDDLVENDVITPVKQIPQESVSTKRGNPVRAGQ